MTGSVEGTVRTCSGPSALYQIVGAVLARLLVIVPIATAIFLVWRMRTRTAPA